MWLSKMWLSKPPRADTDNHGVIDLNIAAREPGLR
jgi:hypothetical protein